VRKSVNHRPQSQDVSISLARTTFKLSDLTRVVLYFVTCALPRLTSLLNAASCVGRVVMGEH
jgi:hypothetical protein